MINQAYALLVNRFPDTDDPAPWARYLPVDFNPLVYPDWLEHVRTTLVGSSTNWWNVTYRAECIMSILNDPWRATSRYWLDTRVTQVPITPLAYYAEPASVLAISVTADAVLTARVEDARRTMNVPIKEQWVVTYLSADVFTITKVGTAAKRTEAVVAARIVLDAGITLTLTGVPTIGDTWRITAFTRPSNLLGSTYVALGNLSASTRLALLDSDIDDDILVEYSRIYATSQDPSDRIDAVASAFIYHASKLHDLLI